ncbi:MAG: HEAT repeat domain-containing protein [Bacteroidota bacterium]|nr:HEAT repeat domain-containing protein [Bacteroidota bacterium]
MFLLNTGYNNAFETFVKPVYLYVTALLFILLTLTVVAATFRLLQVKKKQNRFKNSIQQTVENWITEIIIEDTAAVVTIPENFQLLLTKPAARQWVIDELVRNKSSFLGNVSANIVRLYFHLGLNVDSRIKLDDKKPHVQCQGIHELAVMEQNDQLQKIYRLTNSKNKDVRIEAQTAILQWYGFKGLRFLDVVSFPITDFQQLKLLELLRLLPFTGFTKLNKWLQSPNDNVVSFALKLAEHYQQVQVHAEAVQCLQHENEAVRVQAVKTLAKIGTSETAKLLTAAYENERFTNRLNILKELPKIASDEQRDFLIVQLHEGHEYLKLAAAKVLAKCTTDGMEILEAKSYETTVPYKDIFLHIKSEVGK